VVWAGMVSRLVVRRASYICYGTTTIVQRGAQMTSTQIALRTDRSTAALVAQYIRELAGQGR
jgi:hypothetical protein